MVEQRFCKICRCNMKKEFPGLYHCKCGMTWMVNKGYFQRTPDMEFVCEEVSFRDMIAYMPRMTTAEDREKLKAPSAEQNRYRGREYENSPSDPYTRKPEDIVYGGIYYVLGGERTGDEIHSSRPAVVVSDVSENNERNIVTVAYLTKQYKKSYETRTVLRSSGKYATFLAEQIETVDVRRLAEYYGKVTTFEMTAIKKCLAVHLGLRRFIATDEAYSDHSHLIAQQAAQIKALEAQLAEQTYLSKEHYRQVRRLERKLEKLEKQKDSAET